MKQKKKSSLSLIKVYICSAFENEFQYGKDSLYWAVLISVHKTAILTHNDVFSSFELIKWFIEIAESEQLTKIES